MDTGTTTTSPTGRATTADPADLGAPVRRGRVAVLADVSGHRDVLHQHLLALGAAPDSLGRLRLPEDLTVILAGDLIHRGPDSPGLLRLVDDLAEDHPNRVLPLAGNHEDQYVSGRVIWPERLPSESAELLRHWWSSGRMRAAVSITCPAAGLRDVPAPPPGREQPTPPPVTTDWVISHAGVTAQVWARASAQLGGPATADAMAAVVNAWIPDDPRLHRAGDMLYGVPDRLAGPMWAASSSELLPSWLEWVREAPGRTLPFSQVHGHSCAFIWERGHYREGTPFPLMRAGMRDPQRRHLHTPFPGGTIIAADPCHDTTPAPSAPVVFTDALVTAC